MNLTSDRPRPTISPLELEDDGAGHGSLRPLAVLLAVALAVRLGFVAMFPWALSLDTSGYDAYATNLLERGAYTRFDDRAADSDLPPLYPAFLAVIYTLLGRSPLPVAVVQALLDILTIGLLFFIGLRLAGPQVGLIGAGAYAFSPYMLYQNLTVNDTALAILLLTCGVWLGYTALDKDDWRFASACGAALGLAALTKPWSLLLVPLFMAWWIRRLGLRRSGHLVLAAALAACLVAVPWIVRNSLLHGHPAFISTNDGSNLYQGNNPCLVDYLAHGWDAQWVDCLAPTPAGMSEWDQNQWFREQALTYLKDHPDQWVALGWAKLAALWSPAITPSGLPPEVVAGGEQVTLYHTPLFNLARWLHLATFGPLLIAGMAGLALAWQRRLEIWPLLAVIAVVTVTYVVFHPSTRYRAPADPFVFLLAAVSIEQSLRWIRGPTR